MRTDIIAGGDSKGTPLLATDAEINLRYIWLFE